MAYYQIKKFPTSIIESNYIISVGIQEAFGSGIQIEKCTLFSYILTHTLPHCGLFINISVKKSNIKIKKKLYHTKMCIYCFKNTHYILLIFISFCNRKLEM